MWSRALHLARAEFPFLEGVRAGSEGYFESLEETVRGIEVATADRALVMVLTSLIDLLVSFIGEELTLRLVGEVWPDVSLLEPIQPGTFDGQEAAS
jgi:hypothetical protein